jgi:poly(A) polymerase
MTQPEDTRFAWLADARLQRILGVLNQEGEARLVGGCVRDALLGADPLTSDAIDIDIATDRTPDEMKAVFAKARMRAVSTGEEHGTLTVIEDGLVAECTTLRADEETDGRHARVRFTRDWDADWCRRDFTINALYLGADGKLFDPAGGLADLEARRVRFIGDPEARITEDALRILRFFRFSARFAERMDEKALAAIAKKTELLGILSKERIWSEFSRLLNAKNAVDALAAADGLGVVRAIVPEPARLDVFSRLPKDVPRSGSLGLAALWPDLGKADLKRAFKPAAETIKGYEEIIGARNAFQNGMAAHELLYRFGWSYALAALRLAAAEGAVIDPAYKATVMRGEVPKLPVSGRDFVARGIAPGPEVGEATRRFERLWLDEGTPTDEDSIGRLTEATLRGETPR